MSVNTDPSLRVEPTESNRDCLVELVDEAEKTGPLADNPMLGAALDAHVVLETGDDSVELMCAQCPVMCTVKTLGGNAIALVHNRTECIDNN